MRHSNHFFLSLLQGLMVLFLFAVPLVTAAVPWRQDKTSQATSASKLPTLTGTLSVGLEDPENAHWVLALTFAKSDDIPNSDYKQRVENLLKHLKSDKLVPQVNPYFKDCVASTGQSVSSRSIIAQNDTTSDKEPRALPALPALPSISFNLPWKGTPEDRLVYVKFRTIRQVSTIGNVLGTLNPWSEKHGVPQKDLVHVARLVKRYMYEWPDWDASWGGKKSLPLPDDNCAKCRGKESPKEAADKWTMLPKCGHYIHASRCLKKLIEEVDKGGSGDVCPYCGKGPLPNSWKN